MRGQEGRLQSQNGLVVEATGDLPPEDLFG